MNYDIASNKASQKAMILVRQGKLRIVKESGVIFLTSNDRPYLLTVHKNYRYIFDEYLKAHGNGDGFFEETSQTAG